MASTAEGSLLTRTYRRQQVSLAQRAIAEGLLLWRALDPQDIPGTSPTWTALTIRSILTFRRLSALLAARYMQAFRVAEVGAPLPPGDGLVAIGNGAVIPAGATTFDDKVRDALGAALRINGPVALQRALDRGQDTEQAAAKAYARTVGVIEKGVLDGGREVQTGIIRADRDVVAVARVTSGDACAFCTMLASRGFDYSTEKAAGFKAHGKCACTTEVLYAGAEPNLPPSSRKAAEQWDAYLADRKANPERYADLDTEKQAGPNRGDERDAGEQAMLGFRRFTEDRGPSAFRGEGTGAKSGRSGGKDAAVTKAGEKSAERAKNVRLQLQQLRARRDAATPQQRKFIDGRIAELEDELAAAQ